MISISVLAISFDPDIHHSVSTIRHNDLFRLAFNQYDYYPCGLGTDIVKFILGLNGPEDYAEMAQLVRKITGPTNWFCLLYKIQGATALPAIQSGILKHMVESIDFLEDGIFCEWAYFIDFENQTLEIWTFGQHVADASFRD
ncbi:unnamed protein product [Cyclocybe aegerita]|uniref:Uncharacterized protein n=1 Tax=Cyclocybe aegerita TaxID=1973307 RepID=A0A8S0VSL8_CYCAE|nr:unnamed protein product [Cyclocybe aegerita]